jgi:hypothetical protein
MTIKQMDGSAGPRNRQERPSASVVIFLVQVILMSKVVYEKSMKFQVRKISNQIPLTNFQKYFVV